MDLPLLRKIFAMLGTYLTLVPVAAAFINYKFLDKNFKLLLAYLIFSFITDQVCAFYFFKGVNNLLYINIFVLAEPLVMIYLLCQWPPQKKKERRFDLYFILALVVIFWIWQALIHRDINGTLGINNQMKIFSTITGAAIAIFSSVRLLRLVESGTEITRNPRFWVISAIFIYSTCSLIVISTVFLVPKSGYILFSVTNIIYYLILTKAFMTCRK